MISADELRGRLRGPLLLPGDAGYDESRSIWNAMIDRRPAAIARCAGVADIVACIDFARAHNVVVSIKGGGHNIAGLAVAEGGLMLDLASMRGVWVDPAARRARAQAGCLLARVVRASESENADLFWALRGGGGNFGVVTSFEYALHPVGPQIVAGAIAWPAEQAPEILEKWRRITENAPPELTCVSVLRIAPPAPWLSKEIHGKPIIALFVCDSGPIDEAERRVGEIKQWGAPVGDVVQRRSYVSQQELIDVTQPKGRRYYWKSEYLPRVEPALIDGLVTHAAKIVSPHSGIIVFPIDGPLNALPNEHSPAGNRDARLVLNITGSWEKPEHDDANIRWARTSWSDLRRFSTC